MILNELVLHNVGTFAGRHVVELTPPSRDKPVVLIGGLNGAGKTTVLESIQLALYGPLAHGSGRRVGSYDSYLRGLIHRSVPASEGAAIELAFSAHQEGVEHTYRVRRSWKSVGNSVREILLVSVDGNFDQSLEATWSEHVETFLPRGIAGLFFFDGEQIEALADLERSRQVLSSALTALLGLDLVERLSADLTVLKRRQKSGPVPEDLRQTIAAKQQLVTAHRQAEEAAVEASAARTTEYERCQKAFHQATEAYRSAGGDLLDQREAAEQRLQHLRGELDQCDDDIRQELASTAPLFQVAGLVEQLTAQVRLETLSRRESLLVEAISDRDDEVLRRLGKAAIDVETVTAIEQFLQQDRKTRQAHADVVEVVGAVDDVALASLITSMSGSRRRLDAAIARRARLTVELDQAERVLAAIPDPEVLAPLQRAREESRNAVLRAEAAHSMATEMLASARQERAKAAAAYESALDKAAHADLAADDDRRLIEHVERVRTTLVGLRAAASRRHLERISELIMEALRTLMRKDNLITDVRIDPETHTVSLTGVDGHDLPAKSLSAGERQLLAVALLWGLARAAGQPLPVVIDTPLGRLDGSHRGHLLDRYFPWASHQVVLLSTDTEFDEDAYSRISPRVGRAYHLEFDPQTSATTVLDGYFWERT